MALYIVNHLLLAFYFCDIHGYNLLANTKRRDYICYIHFIHKSGTERDLSQI